jgi:hypothetical protein
MKKLLLSILALCLILPAFSSVVVHTPANGFLNASGVLNVDMNLDGTDDFALSAYSGWPERLSIYNLSAGSEMIANASGSCWSLNLGGLIGANTGANLWDSSSTIYVWGGTSNLFVLEDTTYLGVRFLINGNTHYGYMKVLVDNYQSLQSMEIYELAYEDVPGWGIRMGSTVTVGNVSPAKDPAVQVHVTQGLLGVDFDAERQGNLHIYSLNGQLAQMIPFSGNHIREPISSFAAGIYLLRIEFMTLDGKAILTRRVLLAQ